jgi:hypothetical protein
MPLEREMLPDRTEAREEFLCAFRVAKAAHATLPFARRLMAVLGPVVQLGCSFDKHVLHVRKLRDFGCGRRVAAQLISDDLARNRTRTRHTLEKAFGRSLVAPLCTRTSSSTPCSAAYSSQTERAFDAKANADSTVTFADKPQAQHLFDLTHG